VDDFPRFVKKLTDFNGPDRACARTVSVDIPEFPRRKMRAEGPRKTLPASPRRLFRELKSFSDPLKID
jgi:hypothetical protein